MFFLLKIKKFFRKQDDKCVYGHSPMWSARKSARHLEDQVPPILRVLPSAGAHRFTRLEGRRARAAHSPQKTITATRPQLHPPLLLLFLYVLFLVFFCGSCSLSCSALPASFTRLGEKRKQERESPSFFLPLSLPLTLSVTLSPQFYFFIMSSSLLPFILFIPVSLLHLFSSSQLIYSKIITPLFKKYNHLIFCSGAFC